MQGTSLIQPASTSVVRFGGERMEKVRKFRAALKDVKPEQLPGPDRRKMYAEPHRFLFSLLSLTPVFNPVGMAYLTKLPRGHGEPILLIPGFMGRDLAMSAMHFILKRKGYAPEYADLDGMNVPSNKRSHLTALEKHLQAIYEKYDGQKVTIIGHSLGGVQARELAKMRPEFVKQLITLGAPSCFMEVNGGISPMVTAMSTLTPQDISDATFAELMYTLHEAPPVPTTSIYTENDGFVHWLTVAQQKKGTAPIENIRVTTSHTALPADFCTMYAVLTKLGQPVGQPFDRKEVPVVLRWLFPPAYPIREDGK